MKTLSALLIAAIGASLAACGSSEHEATASATSHQNRARCDALVGTEVGAGTIESAEWTAKDTPLVNALLRAAVPALADVKAQGDFCRVTALVRAVPNSNIKVEIWLPVEWKEKVLATGGGGFSGGLGAASLTLPVALAQGYAGVASDVGHDATDSAEFAYKSREEFIDYAHRGNHLTAEFAKALVAKYYEKPLKHSYFWGCSNGGRDALMEARRYPEDFDGIIAGAPANSWTRLMASFMWNYQVMQQAPKLTGKLALVNAAVMQKCDAIDAVKDGVLENPAICRFDPVELQCKGAAAGDCLGADEVAALRKIYAGPRLRDGQQILSGLVPGSEVGAAGWSEWVGNEKKGQGQLGIEFYRWMVFGDPKWVPGRFDLDRDYPISIERTGSLMDADDPDLNAFTGRGGKLILYHGWTDVAIPAGSTLAYFDALRARVGEAEKHVKLFMIPGMGHCFGPSFDVITELDRWVEGGEAPQQVIATQYEEPRLSGAGASKSNVKRTRLLCPWPQTAHYLGSGSTDDAANFACK